MDDRELLASLENTNRELAELLNVLSGAEPPMAYRRSWAAGGNVDIAFRGQRAGIAVFNESADAIYVGLAPGAGTAALCHFTIATKRWIALPLELTNISIGGAAAGVATVLAFTRPPAFAGGYY